MERHSDSQSAASTTDAVVRSAQNVPVTRRPRASATWTYRPLVDIENGTDALTLRFDIPGATRDSIDLTVESGVLTVQANIPPRPRENHTVILNEYGVGAYFRQFELPESAATDGIQADYAAGVLSVVIPKSENARRRRIPVTSA